MARYNGYVVVRELIDFDGSMKWYTYYPREKGGKPPYFSTTKAGALRLLKKAPRLAGQRVAVKKFRDEYYLDRY